MESDMNPSFSCFTQLDSHVTTSKNSNINQLTQPTFECNICDLHFLDISQLNDHVNEFHQVHQPSSPNIFYCDICGNEYSKFSGYVDHLHLQHEYNLYHCHKCKIVYYNHHDFETHVPKHHHSSCLSSPDQPLPSDYVDFPPETNNSLNQDPKQIVQVDGPNDISWISATTNEDSSGLKSVNLAKVIGYIL